MILLTNDDGIDAEGLRALKSAVEAIAPCYVIAPAEQKSAFSHAISLVNDIRLHPHISNDVFFGYKVEGTPVDCVKLALCELLETMPDLIISGINRGPNTGVSIYYSGTVAAAREGSIAGIPSMAISIAGFDIPDYMFAARLAASVAQGVLQHGLPRGTMLNINVPLLPTGDIKGIVVTRQAESRFIEEYVKRDDSERGVLYALRGTLDVISSDGNSDEEALRQGYVSVTPLKLDLTDHQAMHMVEKMLHESR